jgi:hypothetical protein
MFVLTLKASTQLGEAAPHSAQMVQSSLPPTMAKLSFQPTGEGRTQHALKFPARQGLAPTACAQMLLVAQTRPTLKPLIQAMQAAPAARWKPSCSPLQPCPAFQNQSTRHWLRPVVRCACARA